MKYDPQNWITFKKSETVVVLSATTQIKLAAPGALYCVSPDGTKTLIGYGSDFKVDLPKGYDLTADQPGVVYRRLETRTEATGEVYTNADKRPMLSPAEQAVIFALRELKVRERALRHQQQEHFEAMMRRREQKGLSPKTERSEPPETETPHDPETGEVEATPAAPKSTGGTAATPDSET